MTADGRAAGVPAVTRVFAERARAKVNLTLRVHGRRGDGYHELSSLVAFAGPEAADDLTLDLDAPRALDVAGPFAPTLAGANLVSVAIDKALAVAPRLAIGRLTLTKRLPVAAGVGGGSADAAATLRLLAAANPDLAPDVDWHAIATSLGADVPVCLASRATYMTGIGECLAAVPSLPPLPAVLVNPRVAVPADKTAQVFRALGAPPLPPGFAPPPPPGPFAGAEDALAFVADSSNDLAPAALRIVPVIGEVMAALRATGGCGTVRLSGGGPTCFALYRTTDEAAAAAAKIASGQPGWWVTATTLA